MNILYYVTSVSVGSVFCRWWFFFCVCVCLWSKVVVAALRRGQHIDECQHCDFKHEILWFNEVKLIVLHRYWLTNVLYSMASMRLCPCGWLHYSSSTDLELGWILDFRWNSMFISFPLIHLTGYDHKTWSHEVWSTVPFSYRYAMCFIWWL